MNKIFLVSVVLCCLLGRASSKFTISYATPQAAMDSIPCILKVFDKFFQSDREVIGSLIIVSITPNGSRFHRAILRSLNEDKLRRYTLMMKNAHRKHYNAAHVREKAKFYLFLIIRSTEITNIMKQLKVLPTYNPLAQVLITMTDEILPEQLNIEIMSVFSELLTYGVLNVNVLYRKINTTDIVVVTWFPYNGTNCADSVKDITVIDECKITNNKYGLDYTSFVNSTFNDKILDKLHGCPLRISSSNWEPYFYYDIKRNKYFGFEYKLTKAIAQHLAMTPQWIIRNISRINIQMNADNISSFYLDLVEGQTDILIGGLDENRITAKYLSSSIPYYFDDLTWCVKKAGLAPNWMNCFAIFSLTTWLVTFVLLIFTAATLQIFLIYGKEKQNENFMWAMLIALGTVLAICVKYNPKRYYLQILFVALLFYGINFNAAYQSFLISILTQPRYETQVNTLNDLIQYKMTLSGGINILDYLKQNDEEEYTLIKNFEICDNIDNCLLKLKLNKSLAVGVSREHTKYNSFITEKDIKCFSSKNNIFDFSVIMLMRKNHHLMPKIGEIIRQLTEVGIVDKWEEQSYNTGLISKHIKSVTSNHNTDQGHVNQTVLTMGHMFGAFLVLFIGILLSIVVFLFEKVFFYFRK